MHIHMFFLPIQWLPDPFRVDTNQITPSYVQILFAKINVGIHGDAMKTRPNDISATNIANVRNRVKI